MSKLFTRFVSRFWQSLLLTAVAALSFSLNFLLDHKFVEAIPLLVGQLDHPELSTRESFHKLMAEIAGRDLGDREGPWLGWYRQHVRAKGSTVGEVRHR